jgi:hypothetical protein
LRFFGGSCQERGISEHRRGADGPPDTLFSRGVDSFLEFREPSKEEEEYDFRQGKHGAVIPQPGKTRITIYMDNDVLDAFRTRAENSGIAPCDP